MRDSNLQPYDHDYDAISLSYRPIRDMNEHINNMYEYIMTRPLYQIKDFQIRYGYYLKAP